MKSARSVSVALAHLKARKFPDSIRPASIAWLTKTALPNSELSRPPSNCSRTRPSFVVPPLLSPPNFVSPSRLPRPVAKDKSIKPLGRALIAQPLVGHRVGRDLSFQALGRAAILLLSMIVGIAGTSGFVALALHVAQTKIAGGTQDTFFSVEAAEDTFVDERKPETPQGEEPILETDNRPRKKRALLRFEVPPIPPGVSLVAAHLELYVVNGSQKPGAIYAADGAWSEATTWSNTPPIGHKIADIPGRIRRRSWLKIDVTRDIVSGGDFSVVLVTEANDSVNYSSSEADSNSPRLTIHWEGSPSPTIGTPTPLPATLPPATAPPATPPPATPLPATDPPPTPPPATPPPASSPTATPTLVYVWGCA